LTTLNSLTADVPSGSLTLTSLRLRCRDYFPFPDRL